VSYASVLQTISWFWDLYGRKVLDLDPPYQRRSVWNQTYREDFVDTITLGYPTPAIFLFADIEASGRTLYHVVDGKQRLLTVFAYLENQFALPDRAEKAEFRGRYFNDLSDEQKRHIWGYGFSVINLPNSDEKIINDIFNRINRNVAKLSRQELRHARFDGVFINSVEALTLWQNNLSSDFPRIADASRRQMRDVEFVASLCLLLEEGVKGYSADDLDAAFSERDDDWEPRVAIEERFRNTVSDIVGILEGPDGEYLKASRLRNQADYYSLFGAVDELIRARALPEAAEGAARLRAFVEVVADDQRRPEDATAQKYYEAARSASNDPTPRRSRIEILTSVLSAGAVRAT